MVDAIDCVESHTGLFRVGYGFRGQRGGDGEGLKGVILGEGHHEIIRVRQDGGDMRKRESESVIHWMEGRWGGRRRGSQTSRRWKVGLWKLSRTM